MDREKLVDRAARIVDEEAMTLTREEFTLENGTYPAWSSENQGARRTRARHVARAIIGVAEAWIRAEALREASQAFGENQMIFEGDVKEWLCLRAEELEKGTKG